MKHVTQVLATGSSAVGEPRHRKLWTNTGSGLSGLRLEGKRLDRKRGHFLSDN